MKALKSMIAIMALLQVAYVSAASVQAGAFAVPSNASRMVSKLTAMGHNPVSVSKGSLQMVRIENLSSRAAYSTCRQLKASGISCFVAGATTANYVAAPHKAKKTYSRGVEVIPPVGTSAPAPHKAKKTYSGGVEVIPPVGTSAPAQPTYVPTASGLSL